MKDCALVTLSTARRAQTLRELRDHLLAVPPASLYHHFWGGLLRPSFDDPEYNNDFASWARHGLHDAVLAERLAAVDPMDAHDLEELRRELVDLIEERLDESDRVLASRREEQFTFLRSQIVVFDTGTRIKAPSRLRSVVSKMSLGSVFYHFIDARRRTERRVDDFRAWLAAFGAEYDPLCELLAGVDPFFSSLSDLRLRLGLLFKDYFGGRRE